MPSVNFDMILGVVIVLLGCSFAYKFVRALVYGQVSYWSGFLPFAVISPFFLHLPAGKRSLIRRIEGHWVTIVLSPVFFICSILCLAAGVDLLGLPGVDTLNWVLNSGDRSKPAAVIFDKQHGYRFPLLSRIGNTLGDRFNKVQVPLSEKDRLY